MSDRILNYWYGWLIEGPDEDGLLLDLRRPKAMSRQGSRRTDKENVADMNYLCKRIIQFPSSTLMDSNVWYRITKLREKSFKNEQAANDWERVIKALLGHRGKRKTQIELNELKAKIRKQIAFFRDFLKQDRENKTIETAIQDLLAGTATDDETQEEGDKKIEGDKYYQFIYYSYNPIYKLLRTKLTDVEIFDFFQKAASNIDQVNALIFSRPDCRDLSYCKTTTWYVLGENMHIELTSN